MTASHAPTLCGQPLGKHKHVCAIFNSREEAREVMGEFRANGCRLGQKNFGLLDPDLVEEAAQDLQEQGVDLTKVKASGICDLKTWHDTYLTGGKFSGEAMLKLVADAMEEAHQAGFDSVWATGDMNWASRDPQNSLEIIKYESQLNELKNDFEDDVWVCFYDASMFNGRIIADIIRAHPVVLLGKRLFENPYYTPPSEFLKELNEYELYKPLRPVKFKAGELLQ